MGNNDRIDITELDQGEKVDQILDDKDYLIEVDLSPDMKKTIDVKYLLMLRSLLTSNQSDAELEDALNRIDPYLFTFKRAIEYWNSQVANIELDFDIWQKRTWVATEEALMTAELAKVEEGIITKSKVNVTKQHVDTALLLNNEEEYRNFKTEISIKRNRLEFLKDLTKLLESRGSRIQTIVNSRRSRV